LVNGPGLGIPELNPELGTARYAPRCLDTNLVST
jgi:hypothetical protein